MDRRLLALVVAILVMPVKAVLADPVSPPGWPLDAQSTTGPTPPPQLNYIIPAAIDTQKLVSGVPAYRWWRGCGPTAAGMVVGYWDGKGFDTLVAGSAATDNTSAKAMMSSTGNYNDYCLPIDNSPPVIPDKSAPPVGDEHPNDCVADFMFTSQSARNNCYGWSWFSDVSKSLRGYTQFIEPDYASATVDVFWAGLTWDLFRGEIDADRPFVILVDSSADGTTDHFVTVTGYGTSAGKNMYACYHTWDYSVHWYEFAGMASGRAFGIYGATFFDIAPVNDQIALARKMIPNASVTLRSAIVTAAYSGYFYVEEDDRSCGIKVNRLSHGLSIGMRADVTGTIYVGSDGEKYISASSAVQNGTGSVLPVAMPNRDVGGGPWLYNSGTKAGQAGVADGSGANTIGMLVCTTGRVTSAGSGYFYIDDGSNLSDTLGPKGIKVLTVTGVAVPTVNSYVQVKGISSCFKSADGKLRRQLRMRVPSDLKVVRQGGL